MNRPTSNKKTGSQKARNSAARLLAVQTVYQMHKNDQDAETAIREYLEHRAGVDIDGAEDDKSEMVTPDADHYALVVRGVTEHMAQLGEMVTLNRGKDLNANEPLLNAIFLCGAFELMVLQSIDAPVIISDYVHVAQAFYEAGESKLTNALLDSIKKTVRD